MPPKSKTDPAGDGQRAPGVAGSPSCPRVLTKALTTHCRMPQARFRTTLNNGTNRRTNGNGQKRRKVMFAIMRPRPLARMWEKEMRRGEPQQGLENTKVVRILRMRTTRPWARKQEEKHVSSTHGERVKIDLGPRALGPRARGPMGPWAQGLEPMCPGPMGPGPRRMGAGPGHMGPGLMSPVLGPWALALGL